KAGPVMCKSFVFLGTTLFWLYITRLAIPLRLSGVVVALMKVYAPIALLLLTAAALWSLTPATASVPSNISPDLASPAIPIRAGEGALATMVAYFALGSLLSVDWGAAVGSRRDILRAGFPCVLAASAWTSIMALVIVTNAASVISADALLSHSL